VDVCGGKQRFLIQNKYIVHTNVVELESNTDDSSFLSIKCSIVSQVFVVNNQEVFVLWLPSARRYNIINCCCMHVVCSVRSVCRMDTLSALLTEVWNGERGRIFGDDTHPITLIPVACYFHPAYTHCLPFLLQGC